MSHCEGLAGLEVSIGMSVKKADPSQCFGPGHKAQHCILGTGPLWAFSGKH